MYSILRVLCLVVVLQNCMNHVSGEICEKAVCEFQFKISQRRTMTYYKGFLKTFKAVFNGSNVILEKDRHGRPLPTNDDVTDDVITADGVRRNIITVNGKSPGPVIEVMEGAQVVVHVTNNLLTQSATIHWHGIHMNKTPWMDGTAYVSQCPIPPRQSFTYRFIASPAGTHWYHDHFHGQRVDGLAGMLIVHKSKPTLPEASLMVYDWFHYEGNTAHITDYYYGPGGTGELMYPASLRSFSHDLVEVSPYEYVSGLINGKGRFGVNSMPLSTTVIRSGQTMLFRMVNSGAEVHYDVSVDQHKLQVVAVDGQSIEPVTVDSFILGLGERIDFLLTANQKLDNYWLRCKTMKAGISPELIQNGIENVVYGIIRYEGAADQDPLTVPRTCTALDECAIFNCPYEGYPAASNKYCIQPNEVKSTTSQSELDHMYGLQDEDVEEYIFNIGFTPASGMNGVSFVNPSMPFSDPHYKKGFASCETKPCKGKKVPCRCTNVVDVPFNKTVQVVFTNYRPAPPGTFVVHAHHTMHLHGHNFAVVYMGFPPYDTTTGRVIKENTDLACDSRFCRQPGWNGSVPELNTDHPQLKDTVFVPAQGYTIVRFRSTNPGHWFLHCHTQSHLNKGMSLIISEAADHIPEPPLDFPTCNSFSWSKSQFSTYINDKSKNSMTRNRNSDGPQSNMPGSSIGQSEPGQTTTPIIGLTKDAFVTMNKQELIGLVIGCVAFGAILMFIPFIIWVCAKS